MTLAGYAILEDLSGADPFVLQRARRIDGDLPVLLKSPRRPGSAAEVERLAHEFALFRELDVPGIPRAHALLQADAGPCLILDDPGGRPLSHFALRPRADVSTALKVGIGIAQLLADVHKQGITVHNLSPASLLVDPVDGRVHLVDLGLASRAAEPATGGRLTPPSSAPVDTGAAVVPLAYDSLAYISPEQTGRMNRGVDARTDLYSAGVILYELLTGTRPFDSHDPMELVHWHIAGTPRRPAEIDSAIPDQLSRLVMKLLAKSADLRYQTAEGLQEDLKTCLRHWSEEAAIPVVPLGRSDVTDRFVVPQHLYGRDAEVVQLLEAFDRACQGPSALMLVGGYSGIGKTTLIEDLYRPLVRQRGYFIAGKFDQVARHNPFGALIQALRSLVQQLLSESEDRQAMWRERLAQALGTNGAVLAEVVPEIELILGAQSSAPALPPVEAQNRFRLVFQNFLGALGRRQHPLVIFLDDLQWADPATLSLLQPVLTSPDVAHLLLIGAYRDNEVDEAHPLMRTMAALQAHGVVPEQIALGPLREPELLQLIADTLHRPNDEVTELARLVLQKTDGNPFFVIQFLRTLHQEGLVRFDRAERRWNADAEAIRRAGMTDNVIDLMTRKIRRLNPAARHAVMLAATLGSPFDLQTLAVVSACSADRAKADLAEAIDEGLILPAEAAYADDPTGTPAGARFVFLHDRVQQAAYTLMPEDERQLVHLTAGRLLRDRWRAAPGDSLIFAVAGHLNIGVALIDDPVERRDLAELNLDAARKAKASTAYQAALGYLQAGLALLTDEQWETDYALLRDLHMEAAECEYFCGGFDRAEAHYALLLARARTRLDRGRVYRMRIVQYENLSRYADAVATGLEALALFGVNFPDTPEDRERALEEELAAITRLLGGRPIAALVDLPVMEDAETRMVMAILTALWASVYIAGEHLLTRFVSTHMVMLSLAHGNVEESAYGYVTHAITVGPGLGDYASGQAFGVLALAVNDWFHDPKLRAKSHHMFSCFVNLWRQPLASCLPHAREAYRSALDTGDFTYATYAVFHESWYGLLGSRDLAAFAREYEPNLALLRKIHMDSFVDAQRVILQWGAALEGRTRARGSLSGDGFDEDAYLRQYPADPASHFFRTFFFVAKLHVLYAFEDHAAAAVAMAEARKAAHSLHGTIWPVLLDFWGALNEIALAGRDGAEVDESRLAAIQQSLARLSDNCPENFRAYWLLLSAELARLSSRPTDAIDFYEQAIDHSRHTATLLDDALAHELFGKFWLRRGNRLAAGVYLREARARYAEWGAAAKAADLAERYADAMTAPVSAPGAVTQPAAAAAREPHDALDISTIAKAAHAIAVEIETQQLLTTLLRIALENAGARRAVFLQDRDGRLTIRARGSVDEVELSPDEGVDLDLAGDLPRSVIQFVRKTGDDVVINDAASEDRFPADPYLRARSPLSILCVAVVHQSRPAGILYLENDLTAGAFTAERVRVMHILSSQAAIALETARLYEGVKQEVERRRQAEEELRAALAEVEALKNRLQNENVYLQEEIRTEHNFEEMVGRSPALLALLTKVERVAPTDTTVLLHGETGTGKELIARAIHSRGRRRARPLLKVNCGAIPAGLVESELFGHVKGAFTGALDRRVGRFELADRGTIFLDEVGELPLDVQVKLLRVLQEQEFEPVGSSRSMRVDVRVIAATNRDLENAVRTGAFRSDLFFRLNVLPLHVPPLRERREDIPLLAQYFLTRFARKYGKAVAAISQQSVDALLEYSWPGNIRELQNVIERAVVLTTGPVLELEWGLLSSTPADTPVTPRSGVRDRRATIAGIARPRPASMTEPATTLQEVERRHILAALERCGGVIEGAGGAARLLGLQPSTLRSRMKRLGVTR